MELFLQQLLNGVSAGMAYALVALGLTVIFGVLHVVNFAHGELYLLGALAAVTAVQQMAMPYYLAVVAAGVLVGAFAYFFDLLVIRPVVDRADGSSAVILTTFSAGLLILHSVLIFYGPSPKRIEGLPGLQTLGYLTLTNQRLIIIGIGLLLFALTWLLMNRTQTGRELRAVAQDQFGARAIGISVNRVRTIAFAFAGGLAGIAGALLVPVTLFTPLMGESVLIKAFVCVVVGGMGSIWGAALCGLVLGILEAVLGSYMDSGFALALIYSLMIAVMLLRPGLSVSRA